MKLSHTRTITEDLKVERDGATIGSRIDSMIQFAIENDEGKIENVYLEITDEDWTALRLLASPLFKSLPAEQANADLHPSTKIKRKLSWPSDNS